MHFRHFCLHFTETQKVKFYWAYDSNDISIQFTPWWKPYHLLVHSSRDTAINIWDCVGGIIRTVYVTYFSYSALTLINNKAVFSHYIVNGICIFSSSVLFCLHHFFLSKMQFFTVVLSFICLLFVYVIFFVFLCPLPNTCMWNLVLGNYYSFLNYYTLSV